MKYTSIAIVLLFLLQLSSAQQANKSIIVEQSSELSLGNDLVVPGIFGHDENAYFAYAYDYRPYIEFLDKNFELKRRMPLNLNENFRRRNLIGLCHFHDTIYVFSTEEHLKSMLLFVETIDKKTMRKNNDDRLLMLIPNQKGWVSSFGYYLSRQQDKLLIYSRLDVLSRNIQDVRLQMYGEGFKLEWEAEQKIVYPMSPPRKSIIKVSDEGDAYFISLLDDQNLRSLWDGVRNRYHMVAVTENGKIVNSYSLSFPEQYIRGVMIEPADNHQLICAGFYSPTHFRGNIDGIFYFRLDNSSGEFLDQTMYEFEPWFLKEAIAEKSRKDPGELFEFRVRQLIRRNNGDFVMIAENQYDQDYDTYQNIIAFNLSPLGALNWTRVIHKRQNIDKSLRLNYSSYGIHAPKESDKIHIIFNDRDKNEFLEPGERLKAFYPNGNTNLKVVGLGANGEMSTNIIYQKANRRMKTPIPLQTYDKLNNEMVIPILRLKRYNYLNVTFTEE